VVQPAKMEKILVFKMAMLGDCPLAMQRESLWMEYLEARCRSFHLRFNIPEPVKMDDAFVFRLDDVPSVCMPTKALHPKRYAIGFLANKDYFAYPNESRPEKRLDDNQLQEVMFRNAWILGKLTSMGIVHEALIPLFHNRTQQGRRSDQGVYEWIRAGRLARWLYSCEYPNIALSGVRDFEHLFAFNGKNKHLYRFIGNHFLSLLLVTGSHFRHRDACLLGYDAGGKPVDARGLFEKEVLKKTTEGIFRNYYEGFVGTGYTGKIPFDLDTLSNRMVEEMGVDRHMEELVRVADQQDMTDKEFRRFLANRGVTKMDIEMFERGIEDIVIHSGPHLGAFNSTISIPELIESVGSMAALCISGRFWNERFGDSKE